MEQLAILNNVAGLTAEQQEAAAMHFEIVQAAKTAVNSLLDLGRKLKRMRDSGRYKDLGFASGTERRIYLPKSQQQHRAANQSHWQPYRVRFHGDGDSGGKRTGSQTVRQRSKETGSVPYPNGKDSRPKGAADAPVH